jgi:hypothetical protein
VPGWENGREAISIQIHTGTPIPMVTVRDAVGTCKRFAFREANTSRSALLIRGEKRSVIDGMAELALRHGTWHRNCKNRSKFESFWSPSPSMPKGDIKVFNASVEVTFDKPVAFKSEFLQTVAEKLESVLGSRPPADQMRVRYTDSLYNYEFSASFFGNNGGLTLRGDRMTLWLNNGIGAAGDVPFILAILKRFGLHLFSEKPASIMFSVAAHVDFEDNASRDAFLLRYDPTEGVGTVRAGALGYVTTQTWPVDIRVMLEPSFSNEECVYVLWSAGVPETEGWTNSIDKLVESFRAAAKVFGVEVLLTSEAQ